MFKILVISGADLPSMYHLCICSIVRTIQLAHLGLVSTDFNKGQIRYKAPLDGSTKTQGRANKFVPFNEWWKETILDDRRGIEFTRERLIRVMANQDGGAHVDPGIDADYIALNETYGWKLQTNEGEDEPLKDVNLHSVRKIAYELKISIEKKLAEVV